MNAFRRIDLEYYRQPLDWLDEDLGPLLTKAAVFCLQDQGHSSKVILKVDHCGDPEKVIVDWQTTIEGSKKSTLPNDQELTQKGAECISLLLARELAGYPYFETARIGTGCDFLLKKTDQFSFDARLEVSGIRRATPANNVSSRIKIKQEQLQRNGNQEFDSFVSVVEFSNPSVAFAKI